MNNRFLQPKVLCVATSFKEKNHPGISAFFMRVLFFGSLTYSLLLISCTEWNPVGNLEGTVNAGNIINVEVDSSRNRYVGITEQQPNSRPTVVKNPNGTSRWSRLPEVTEEGNVLLESMALLDDNPVIIIQPFNQKPEVYKFDGSESWISLTTPNPLPLGSGINPQMVIREGQPCIAYGINQPEGGNHNRLTVVCFNGARWEPVGEEIVSAGPVLNTNLIVGADNKLIVGYRDLANGSRATVKRLEGDSWVTLGEIVMI